MKKRSTLAEDASAWAKKNGYSAQEAADMFGVSKAAWWKFSTGRTKKMHPKNESRIRAVISPVSAELLKASGGAARVFIANKVEAILEVLKDVGKVSDEEAFELLDSFVLLWRQAFPVDRKAKSNHGVK